MAQHCLCWCVVILALLAVPGNSLGHRRLLHGGSHPDSEEPAGSADASSYLDQLQTHGVTPDQRLKQLLGADSLDEEGVNTLLQDVQG